MLSSRQCEHTGIINIFERTEPYVAIGSVRREGSRDSYVWRCHVDAVRTSGRADDIGAAVDQIATCLTRAVKSDRARWAA